MNPFSENLNYIVRRHSDNISTIAQKAGLSRPSLYDLINGKTLPKNQTFNKLCYALSLSDKTIRKLEFLIKSEKIKFSRSEQQIYLSKKKTLFEEVSILLFNKGFELSSSKDQQDADLILRIKTERIPIKICHLITDPQNILGSILMAKFQLNAKSGFICTSRHKINDRWINSVFSHYGIRIVTPKNLIRSLI